MLRVALIMSLACALAACSEHRSESGPEPDDTASAARPAASAPAGHDDAGATLSMRPLALPEGKPGIGFDDLQYAGALDRLLVPAGRSGRLDLVDPKSRSITSIEGFSAKADFGGGHGEGVTSAVYGGGWIFAVDRSSRRLDVVDPKRAVLVGFASLAAGPDYVRWIKRRREIWVTEPDAEQIEVFKLPADGPPTPSRAAAIRVAGGPESLVISTARGRAYTHLWKGKTVAIDLSQRSIVATWPNQCRGSRGIALDDRRGWLLVGCSEGKAVVLDIDHRGRVLGSAATGAGVDVIAYAPALGHLYVPAAKAATLSVLAVAEDGSLSRVAKAPTARGAHCAVADARGDVWVCDPGHGRLLEFRDPAAGASSR